MAKWGKVKADAISLAARLIAAGVRLTTVRALTGISDPESLDLYREVTGKKPSTGSAPTSLAYYTSTALIQYHASAFYAQYTLARIAIPESTLGDTLLEAYASYVKLNVLRHQDKGCIDIDRALVLIQYVENGDLVWKKCSECHAGFISPHALVDDSCPVCESIRKRPCSCCGEMFTLFTMYPKQSVGRYTSLCPKCRESGARPKRKSATSGYVDSNGKLADRYVARLH